MLSFGTLKVFYFFLPSCVANKNSAYNLIVFPLQTSFQLFLFFLMIYDVTMMQLGMVCFYLSSSGLTVLHQFITQVFLPFQKILSNYLFKSFFSLFFLFISCGTIVSQRFHCILLFSTSLQLFISVCDIRDDFLPSILYCMPILYSQYSLLSVTVSSPRAFLPLRFFVSRIPFWLFLR